ncbi:P-loop NTPase fold protein [Streptomyces sp. RKAG293]|uniref:KAP family P-loop NTPase fold protein n=1 Tax=Streptomyces sp. RKAG293 TaxID=2893403 RepID=UPI0020349790|nr:P-loop NTPase fold protein [Streptomyces sp. RKAG293]MCM2421303.1 KAP family NTPase [Streptomyces sp. RKAG293]
MVSPYSPHSSWLPYSLLNDEPVSATGRDLLGAGRVAEQLAGLLVASRGSTPFTLAVDAGWGMGKSSLMRLVDARLSAAPGVQTVWYNAWTSTGDDALEGLIKSVLTGFDKRVLRRGLHRITRHRSLLGVLRALSLVVAGPLGIAAMTDELWNSMNVDAKTRNDMRDVIGELVRDWADAGPGLQDQRMLVVFIDDLDRCSEETVLAVCEAAKIYLDVPGLAFVIGCDRSAMAPNGLLRDMSPAAAAFMEKIFQTSYRIPVTDGEGTQEYVRWCAETAGISRYLDASLTDLLIERSARNPRRIKRLVNGFVLEATLNPMWRDFGPGGVIRTLLIQYFYPDFYRMMTTPSGAPDGDVVTEFRTYAELRRALRGPADDRSDFNPFLIAHDVRPLPPGQTEWRPGLLPELEQQLPVGFPGLAADPAFISLIGELMALPESRELVRQLRQGAPERSLTQLPPPPPLNSDDPYASYMPQYGMHGGPIPYQQPAYQRPSAQPEPPPDIPFAGMYVIWLDDHPQNNVEESARLTRFGAEVWQVADEGLASAELAVREPALLISNVQRGDDANAGFEYVSRLRRSAVYTGPVIFFTDRVTPARERQASALGVEKVTANFEDVSYALHQLSRERAARSG